MTKEKNYKKLWNFGHEIDDIIDENEYLNDILKKSLKLIVDEVDSNNAFVSFFDIYEQPNSVVIDEQGIVMRDMYETIEKILEHSKNKDIEDIFSPDKELFGRPIHVLPLNLEDINGIIGVEKEELSEDDEDILREANDFLDTVIYQKLLEGFENDKKEIMDEVDSIIDKSEDLEDTTNSIIECVVDRTDSVFGFIFDSGDDFEIIGADNTARVAWNNYEEVSVKVKQLVQDCLYKNEIQRIEFDDSDLKVADKNLSNIVGVPLSTDEDELAGVMVIGSEHILNDKYIELIESAASLTDTSILKDKRMEAMLSRFNQYVGDNVLEVLMDNPEWLKPRKEDVVILSVDLVGSTEYANQEDDAIKVFNEVNKYLSEISRILKEDHGGTLDKYIGDEVMGIFGAPVRNEDAVLDAVNCAIDIRDKIDEMNEEFEEKDETTFEIKQTIGSTRAVVGDIGSEDSQKDYTVLGDGVNKFFRMTKYCSAGEIIINEEMYDEINDDYDCSLKDEVEVKGVDESLKVYSID